MLASFVSALPILALVIAGANGNVDLPNWAQWGILGAAVLALATGKFLVPAYLYNSEREARVAAEERERALREGEVQATHDALRDQASLLASIAAVLKVTRSP